MIPYEDFIRAKMTLAPAPGLPCGEVNPILKPHQAEAVRWSVQGGRRALFEAFGLGKTVQQLEIVRLTLAHAGGRGLIVAPLGVRQEFMRDAAMLGTPLRFVRRIEECDAEGLYLTNYETVRDGKLDPLQFRVVSLDEADVLRGFGGTKTFREFMASMAGDDRKAGVQHEGVPYRFVATATPSPNEYIELLAYAAFLGIMDVGQAKAQPLDAKVLTPTGWRRMGDLAVGDLVISASGASTEILGVYPQGDRQVYRVTFNDGGSTECDADHLWLTQTQYERNNERRYLSRNGSDAPRADFWNVRATSEIAATLTSRGGANHCVPVAGAARFEPRQVTVHPWLLGALLGDACLRETSIVFSTVDDWMLQRVRETAPAGLRLRQTAEGGCDYSLTMTGRKGGNGPGSNPLLAALRGYQLLGKRSWEKAVPRDYLFNSIDVRLSVLRGLMDTDGTVGSNSGPSFTTTSSQLAADVLHLVRSLGGVARTATCKTAGRLAYRLTITMPDGVNPFSLPRKAARVTSKGPRAARRYIIGVEPVGTKAMQCIAIAHPSRLYITDDFIVTHNTRFFKRDSTKADQLTLLPSREREFWMWVSSWALFMQRPSDLGFSDDGYALPPLRVVYHEVTVDQRAATFTKAGQGEMFREASHGVVDAAREKRETLQARVAKAAEIIAAQPAEHWLIWHDLEDERRAIEAAIPGVVSVYGTQDLEEREGHVVAFSEGRIPRLASKPVLLGSGCNFQRHCARAVFTGIGFKFRDLIQAIHRIQRFLQVREVEIHIIHAESERAILRTLLAKWQRHEEQVAIMADIIRKYGLSHGAMAQELQRAIGVERVEITGQGYTVVNNDCVLETRRMAANSAHLVLTSIPFSSQYEYSPSYLDFGHNESNEAFFAQMDYLAPELLRVLQPGRLCAIHVKDRIVPGGINGFGFQTLYPFSDDVRRCFQRAGFAYLGAKTIVTDVVRENNQTYRLGWTEQCKDGSRMGFGVPEYLLLFRKPPSSAEKGYADMPVVKDKATYRRARWQFDAHGFGRSSGNRQLSPEELRELPHATIFKLFREHSLTNVYDFEFDVRLAEALELQGKLPTSFMLLQPQSWHPDVWTDITRMLTLNGAQSAKGKESHLCPMQFDLADRAITQWSMPGETVYDPFGGLMTVPYRAVLLGRQGIGCELSPAYFADGAAYCEAAAREASMPSLFDALEAA